MWSLNFSNRPKDDSEKSPYDYTKSTKIPKTVETVTNMYTFPLDISFIPEAILLQLSKIFTDLNKLQESYSNITTQEIPGHSLPLCLVKEAWVPFIDSSTYVWDVYRGIWVLNKKRITTYVHILIYLDSSLNIFKSINTSLPILYITNDLSTHKYVNRSLDCLKIAANCIIRRIAERRETNA